MEDGARKVVIRMDDGYKAWGLLKCVLNNTGWVLCEEVNA